MIESLVSNRTLDYIKNAIGLFPKNAKVYRTYILINNIIIITNHAILLSIGYIII